MKVTIWLFYLLFFFSCSGFAQITKPFILTYIDYPYAKGYTDFFEEIYTELGFAVKVISTPSRRGLILVNEESADADVLRIGSVAKDYPNLIVVQPEISLMHLTLLCAIDKPCSKELLADKHITVMIANNAADFLEPGEFKARAAPINSFVSIHDMLKANRFDYALFLLDDLMERKFSDYFQFVRLTKIPVNHVIHKKHHALLPKIEEKIRIKLPEFNRKRAMESAL